ncbi:sepiapterin reductase-like [Chiloscyllium plagiosum]|uniref:sepiapterin reductase-like n=1 Tax=Chiloscyllium plagiosum TaxID=36176 RepID=UPI001CB7DCCF|nr:sepiapterin reductase-like [Chiloscyllium plagiosum]
MAAGRRDAADLGRSLCIITGASRGLGWALSMVLAPRLMPGSHLVLVARSGERLQQLEARLLEESPGRGGQVRLSRVEADLSREEGLQRVLNTAISTEGAAPDRLLLINNAERFSARASVQLASRVQISSTLIGCLCSAQLTVSFAHTGPLDTDMQKQARLETADPELRQTFLTMHQEGQLINCHDSARKLVNILIRDDFPSGAHIDYYDQ